MKSWAAEREGDGAVLAACSSRAEEDSGGSLGVLASRSSSGGGEKKRKILIQKDDDDDAAAADANNAKNNNNKSEKLSYSSSSYPYIPNPYCKFGVIKEGAIVDLPELLCSKSRDFLLTSDGTRVKVDELQGKVVIIHVTSLGHDGPFPTLHDLKETYNHLNTSPTSCPFEVVLVASDDWYLSTSRYATPFPEALFTQICQDMPWLSVPFQDRRASQHIVHRLGLAGLVPCWFTLIDSSGRLLKRDVSHSVQTYGPEGFPFSDQRTDEIDSEDERALENLSLVSLLASSDRDYLINNEGSKVQISSLERKVVGLYFFEDAYTDRGLTDRIKAAYLNLKNQRNDFEIVLIDLSHYVDDSKSFWEGFKTMPWLALPFKDPKRRKLSRVFEYNNSSGPWPMNSLVIVGPHGSYVEPNGADILERYGIDAYPYTHGKAVEIEMTSLMNLELDSLFDPAALTIGTDETKIRDGQFSRKRVLLLLVSNIEFFKSSLFLMLREMYSLAKGKDDEFELICIGYDQTVYKEYIVQEMPWRVQPFCTALAEKIIGRLFRSAIQVAAVVAFDEDGKLMAKEDVVPSRETWNDVFPYIDKDLRKQILLDLLWAYGWHYQYKDEELEKLGFQ